MMKYKTLSHPFFGKTKKYDESQIQAILGRIRRGKISIVRFDLLTNRYRYYPLNQGLIRFDLHIHSLGDGKVVLRSTKNLSINEK